MNTYVERTTSTAGNGQKFTISGWYKLSGTSQSMELFNCYGGNTTDANVFHWYITSNNLRIVLYQGTSIIKTNRVIRDPNAWYNIVLAVDTTQATDSNRIKLYINGVQETSFSATVYPAQNYSYVFGLGTSKIFTIGAQTYDGGSGYNWYYDGSMSYVAFVDGTAELPTIFGETDSVTGQWKIKTDITPSVAWGTNGFLILKNGNSLTDESTNTNNFTLGGGTLTNTLDCPDNVFATFNPLYSGNAVYSNGNLTSTISTGTDKFGGVSTIGVASGKWYAEFKALSDTSNNIVVGIYGKPGLASNNNQGVGKETDSISYRSDGSKGIENTFSSYGATYTTNDIIGVALDLDSGTKTITFYKNGANQGAITISLTPDEGFWFLSANSADSGKSAIWSANFGNGYFGTTAVTSAGTAGSTPGVFEYDVPSGYEPLTTKGLNA